MKQIDWTATLNNIVFTHKSNEVLFNIRDIEHLTGFVNNQQRTLAETRRLLNKANQEILRLQDMVLHKSLSQPTSIDTYKINLKA
jgi:hypothetical protein